MNLVETFATRFLLASLRRRCSSQTKTAIVRSGTALQTPLVSLQGIRSCLVACAFRARAALQVIGASCLAEIVSASSNDLLALQTLVALVVNLVLGTKLSIGIDLLCVAGRTRRLFALVALDPLFHVTPLPGTGHTRLIISVLAFGLVRLTKRVQTVPFQFTIWNKFINYNRTYW